MRKIYTEISEQIKKGEVVFFVAAGASFAPPSNLPISKTLLKEFVSLVLPKVIQKKLKLNIETLSDSIRFEVFFQLFVDIFGSESIHLLNVLESGDPNFNHLFIAKLASYDYFKNIITTNFDGLLEAALNSIKTLDYDVISNDDDYKRINFSDNKLKLIKLHGSLRDKLGTTTYDSIMISVNQVGKSVNKHKQITLKYLIKNFNILFIGYSGMDDFDLFPLFLKTKSIKSIYWVNHKPSADMKFINANDIHLEEARLDKNYTKILSGRKRGYLIEGETFDFINKLNIQLFKSKIYPPIPSKKTNPDFSYFENWKSKVNLNLHKDYLAGLILNLAGKYDSAIFFFNKIQPTSKNFHISQIQKSISLKFSNQIIEARSLLKETIDSKGITRIVHVKCLISLGLIEAESSNFKLSRKYLFKALRLGCADKNDLSKLRNNLAVAYMMEGDLLEKSSARSNVRYRYKKALENLKESLKLTIKTGDIYHLANLEDNIGLMYTKLGYFKEANRMHKRALNSYKSLYLFRELASCYDNLGNFYMARKNYLAAIDNFEKALELKVKHSTKRRIAITKHNLAGANFMLNRYDDAQKYANDALDLFHSENLNGYYKVTRELLVKIENKLAL